MNNNLIPYNRSEMEPGDNASLRMTDSGRIVAKAEKNRDGIRVKESLTDYPNGTRVITRSVKAE